MDRILDSGSNDWGSTPHGDTQKDLLSQTAGPFFGWCQLFQLTMSIGQMSNKQKCRGDRTGRPVQSLLDPSLLGPMQLSIECWWTGCYWTGRPDRSPLRWGWWTFLNYVLTKCQTKVLRVPILAPKYDLVDFVAFSGDSQNTDCCIQGRWNDITEGVEVEGVSLFCFPFLTSLFLLPSDLLTAPFF